LASGAFEDVTVVEFAGMVSGPYCGKLLADMGADVLKIEERPDGDPARARGPFPDDTPDAERSGLFLYLNANKRSVALDVAKPACREILFRLVDWADVLIDDHSPGVLDGIGFDWGTLHGRNRNLILTSITAYGRSGPRAGRKGTDLTGYHSGGLGTLLPPRSTDVSRAPVKAGGYPTGYHAGLTAALATAAALFGRRDAGGCLIDVSEQESIVSLVRGFLAQNVYQRVTWSRVPDRPPAFGRMECSDGYVVTHLVEDRHWRALVELMGNPEWAAGDEWNSFAYRCGHLFEIGHKIDEWARTQKKEDFHRRGGAKGFAIGPVYNAEEVLNEQQYQARDYFVEVDHPQAGELRHAGWPYKMSASPPGIRRPAPLLGEHSREVLRDVLGHTAGEYRALRRSGAIWKEAQP
jgi:crotonobetainyl-CoA:carnitine CoA-transferase CaiB-like acyl-CoA transferase